MLAFWTLKSNPRTGRLFTVQEQILKLAAWVGVYETNALSVDLKDNEVEFKMTPMKT